MTLLMDDLYVPHMLLVLARVDRLGFGDKVVFSPLEVVHVLIGKLALLGEHLDLLLFEDVSGYVLGLLFLVELLQPLLVELLHSLGAVAVVDEFELEAAIICKGLHLFDG